MPPSTEYGAATASLPKASTLPKAASRTGNTRRTGNLLTLDGQRSYPLRPELVESTLYLSRATGDPHFFDVGRDMLHSLERTKVECGHASVADVETMAFKDQMDSYFLSETVKYLYLLFSPGHWALSGRYVFSTEGHPLRAFPFHGKGGAGKPSPPLSSPKTNPPKPDDAPRTAPRKEDADRMNAGAASRLSEHVPGARRCCKREPAKCGEARCCTGPPLGRENAGAEAGEGGGNDAGEPAPCATSFRSLVNEEEEGGAPREEKDGEEEAEP
ncbi:glycosyl hydrolase family 47-domain-containing protein, partial [Baffinella frigidus]